MQKSLIFEIVSRVMIQSFNSFKTAFLILLKFPVNSQAVLTQMEAY